MTTDVTMQSNPSLKLDLIKWLVGSDSAVINTIVNVSKRRIGDCDFDNANPGTEPFFDNTLIRYHVQPGDLV